MFGFTARTRTRAVFGENILDALSMAAEVEPLGCRGLCAGQQVLAPDWLFRLAQIRQVCRIVPRVGLVAAYRLSSDSKY
jgi:hypothetical protein